MKSKTKCAAVSRAHLTLNIYIRTKCCLKMFPSNSCDRLHARQTVGVLLKVSRTLHLQMIVSQHQII